MSGSFSVAGIDPDIAVPAVNRPVTPGKEWNLGFHTTACADRVIHLTLTVSVATHAAATVATAFGATGRATPWLVLETLFREKSLF